MSSSSKPRSSGLLQQVITRVIGGALIAFGIMVVPFLTIALLFAGRVMFMIMAYFTARRAAFSQVPAGPRTLRELASDDLLERFGKSSSDVFTPDGAPNPLLGWVPTLESKRLILPEGFTASGSLESRRALLAQALTFEQTPLRSVNAFIRWSLPVVLLTLRTFVVVTTGMQVSLVQAFWLSALTFCVARAFTTSTMSLNLMADFYADRKVAREFGPHLLEGLKDAASRVAPFVPDESDTSSAMKYAVAKLHAENLQSRIEKLEKHSRV